jgi:energy-coupling factor transporter ATP-binding protein EcfA2
MSKLTVNIQNIKSIKDFSIEIPIEQGLYAIAGTNGVGKSTLMALLAIPFRPALLKTLFDSCSIGSRSTYSYDGKRDSWLKKSEGWVLDGQGKKEVWIDGFIEGSIIHGTRFTDSTLKTLQLSDTVNDEHLVDADDFINENFSQILHGKKNVYPIIKKVKNRRIAEQLGFDSVPYFMEYNGKRLSQYWLSTGENLLLSLLHFLTNKIFQQKKRGSIDRSFILVDEIELALHPVAIKRLVTLLSNIAEEYNLAIYFSTHSTELLRSLAPSNIFYLQSLPDNSLEVINPCYPAYATRFLYNQDGYDILILAEDELAKFVIDKIIINEKLYGSKLYHILPCGDWRNTVRLHKEITDSNLTNSATKTISILDGDISSDFEAEKIKKPEYASLNITYLPIPSLEKYLHLHLISVVDRKFFRDLNDRFFRRKSLDDLVSEYKSGTIDLKGKKLWNLLVGAMSDAGMSEKEFLREICNTIYERINSEALIRRIRAIF